MGKRRVTLDYPTVDRYKHLICIVWLDGKDVNRLMAENERHGSTTTTVIVATTTQLRTQHEATSATFGQRVKKGRPSEGLAQSAAQEELTGLWGQSA